MRLLHTEKHQLREFTGRSPHYAILSHRWEGAEVTLQDLQTPGWQKTQGGLKIINCCKQAVQDGWIWVVSGLTLLSR